MLWTLEFESMDGDEIDFCVYLFLDGVKKDSDCASGTFCFASLSSQRQTLDEVIDDFNQDLDDLGQQWQNDLDDLFSTPESVHLAHRKMSHLTTCSCY